MNLDEKQAAAVEMAVQTAHQPGAVMVLSGYAGCGKSTTLNAIAERLGRGNMRGMATTGKAARRASKLAGMQFTTCHRFIYTPVDDKGQVRFMRKDLGDDDRAALYVVDEASMLTQDVYEDILFGVNEMDGSLLLVGDSFQLPPVQPDAAKPWSVFTDLQPTHQIMLTEVHRQALDSPILACATKLRETAWKDAITVVRAHLKEITNPPQWAANQLSAGGDSAVIAHRNTTRLKMNKAVRYLMGHKVPHLQPGEPLLVRRNSRWLGLSNGDITAFSGFCGSMEWEERSLRLTRVGNVTAAVLQEAIFGDEPDLTFKQQGKMNGMLSVPYLMANLGYVMTCHNAQGSEWASVCVAIEKSLIAMPEQERVRWMYTALTRSSKECVFSMITE